MLLEALPRALLPSSHRCDAARTRAAPKPTRAASGLGREDKRRVTFAEAPEVVEYPVVEDKVRQPARISSTSTHKPTPAAPCSQGACAQPKKRGRPTDSPLVKAEKKIKLKERLIEHAEKAHEKLAESQDWPASIGGVTACGCVRSCGHFRVPWCGLEDQYWVPAVSWACWVCIPTPWNRERVPVVLKSIFLSENARIFQKLPNV
jgi:hypothetical protein